MRELTIKVLADKVTEEQIDRIDKLLMSEFKPENIVILEEEYIEENTPVWLSLKDVLLRNYNSTLLILNIFIYT